MTSLPTFDQLMNPTLKALKLLGGSGNIDEIHNKVVEILSLPSEQIEQLHDPQHGGQTELEYRLAWSRSYLKKFGVLENSSRGVWALTPTGREVNEVNPTTVKKFYKNESSTQTSSKQEEVAETADEIAWRDEVVRSLLDMQPDAFERLVQRLLRESGFIQVVVTGRSGDGGIDGKGIMRLAGLLSFHVIFQCKRYQGSVGAGQVRDFRGAMVGRADKGLLITTGNFTKEAVREATRDGAPTIDLIDGELLADKLRELRLGVNTRLVQVEKIEIDQEWFKSI